MSKSMNVVKRCTLLNKWEQIEEEQRLPLDQILKYLHRLLNIVYDTFASRLRELAYLNKGITISISDQREKEKKENFKVKHFILQKGLQNLSSS